MSAIFFSPLTAVAVGPAGPPSKLTVTPYSSPSTAIVVTANGPVVETDFQWVQLGLTVPAGLVIRAMVVCYQIVGSPKGTYISQTRLTEMTTPNSALVVHDDPTNLLSPTPVCYTSVTKGPLTLNGTITLALKMVIAMKSDKILVGGISLLS
jgi:hypothetical protein